MHVPDLHGRWDFSFQIIDQDGQAHSVEGNGHGVSLFDSFLDQDDAWDPVFLDPY